MTGDEFDVISSLMPRTTPAEPSPADDLVAALEGDPQARLRVAYRKARRACEDERGRVVIAKAKHEAARDGGKASAERVVELEEAAARARRRLEVAEEQESAARVQLDRAAAVHQQTRDLGGEESPTGRILRFSSVVEFVNEYALPNWGHPLGTKTGARWCERWWLHASALAAMDALWEAFEVMRLAPPPSLATWTRDYLWPFMSEITRQDGPFHSCSPTGSAERPGHDPEKAWPSSKPPAGFVQTYPSETELLRRGVAAGRSTP